MRFQKHPVPETDLQRMPTTTMVITSTQSCDPKTHLREGAIYKDSSNNIIRLVSIRGDYCVYVYVAFGNPRSEIYGPVTGFTRRHVFEGVFTSFAESVEGWNGSQRKSPDRRVQALHVPSSLGSVDLALVSKPHKRRSMRPQVPPPIYDQTGRVNGAEIVFLRCERGASHVMPNDTLRAPRSCYGSAQSPAAQRHESLVDLPSSRQNRLPA